MINGMDNNGTFEETKANWDLWKRHLHNMRRECNDRDTALELDFVGNVRETGG
ncbi:MAG: hypothetical protein HDR03_14595 [Lachnospiraceae bacterium]|nr:hypothetical protein [Lachnospiraceae bacterium]